MLTVRRRSEDCSYLPLLGTAGGATWWQREREREREKERERKERSQERREANRGIGQTK
ncbi:hypothetical protein ALC60_03422 [Trachymyrmex zeteki]|uniref:Uncharacterized protein n=1 Tax=Mycetomoellerius zeteki TaxID=64791 RepID=A0A151XAQ4_9HYME|nr:hypothetical protein ALC60_03422 [Trachymyrmex zeteki]